MFFIIYNDKHRFIGDLNRLWARVFFFLVFIPIEVINESNIPEQGQYIFCANHFSYMDIPVLAYLNFNAFFIGKSSLAKIPIFGYMFKKIHIPVDRSNLKSRSEALKKGMDALDKGVSLIFFPEGGIISKDPPRLNGFKDGAFRLAKEKQIPIVPVTIPNNWIILPDDNKFLLKREKAKIILHKPIDAKVLMENDIQWIKKETYRIIDQELKKHFS